MPEAQPFLRPDVGGTDHEQSQAAGDGIEARLVAGLSAVCRPLINLPARTRSKERISRGTPPSACHPPSHFPVTVSLGYSSGVPWAAGAGQATSQDPQVRLLCVEGRERISPGRLLESREDVTEPHVLLRGMPN